MFEERMTTENPYESYKKTQIQTANQGKLIVMLYDGAIKFAKAAIDAIKNKKIEVSHKNIMRTEDIITELLLSLDYERGGEIAKKLASIYIYLNQQLLEANITKKKEPLEIVVRLMSDLRESWDKISNKSTENDLIDMDKKTGLNISG
jgi:flagellar secretion chaperone FliS